MSDWSDTQWFTAADAGAVVSNTTAVNNAGETDATAGIWPSSSGSDSTTHGYTEDAETSAAGGSGTTPAITIVTDYWLRVETGEVLTDEAAGPLSLESL